MKHQKLKSELDVLEAENLLTPHDIECIMEEPEKMEHVARAMGAVNLENLFKAMQDPRVAAPAKLEFQKMLNKMSGFESAASKESGAAGPQVVINITRKRDAGLTIDGNSSEISI